MPFLGGGVSFGMLEQLYRSTVSKMLNSNVPDVNYSPTSATTYTLSSPLIVAKNFTVGPNATIKPAPGATTTFIICDTLNLNGVIDNTGQGSQGGANSGSGGNYGGNGGAGIVVLARNITGTGTLKVNGANGASTGGSATTGVGQAGSAGSLFGYYDIPGGNGGTYSSTGPQQVNNANISQLNAYFPTIIQAYLQKQSISTQNGVNTNSILTPDYQGRIVGAGGGQGGFDQIGDGVTKVYGGNGGNSPVALGGQGGPGGTNNGAVVGSIGGAGGGGAAAIIIISENAIPAINLQAIGGNGSLGAGAVAGGQGAGGAGGLVNTYAPSSAAIINVSGGTGYNTGANGLSLQFPFQP